MIAKLHFRTNLHRTASAGGRWSIPAAVLIALGVASSLAASADKRPAPAWPPPPAAPCVVYEKDITRPADIGAKPSALRRFSNWITGEGRDAGRLVKPFGLCLSEPGHLLLTDTGANAVCLLDLGRKKWTRWDAVGKTRFQSPVAVAHHGQTYFVADSALGKVIAFDEQGRLAFEITQNLARPSGLALSGGKLFIADAQLHHVVVCDVQGKFLSTIGRRGSGSGEFNFPTHVSADAAGRIYVTDSLNQRIQVFDADGRFVRAFGSLGDVAGSFTRPKGAAPDAAGRVFVVDAAFDNVQLFDDQGRLLLNWGEAGTGPGQFCLPNAIAVSAANEIYVADSFNHRIQVFRYTGKP
jgi:DNA-binding beta-propeller fold protein YncE